MIKSNKILLVFLVLLVFLQKNLAQNCSTSPIVAIASNTIINTGQASTLSNTGCIGGKVTWATSTGASISNLTVQPTSTITYRATCTFSSTNTCASTVQITVLPTCDITAAVSASTISAGGSTILSHTGCSQGLVKWRKANDTDYINNLTVSPSQSVSYTATCVYATGVSCSSTVAVTVLPACSIDALASATTITTGESSTLLNTGCPAGAVSWVTGNTTVTNLTVSPTATTTYTARCTYGNATPCTDNITITVLPVCTLAASISPTEITVGQSGSLTATGCTNGGQLSWVNTKTNQSVGATVNPTETTTYRATCTYSNGKECIAETTLIVKPNCNLTAATSRSNLIVGQNTVLYHTGCVGGLVTWRNGNTEISNLTVGPTVNTTYTATCTYTNNTTCTSSVTVNVASGCGIVANASNLAIFSGQNSTLSASNCSGTVTWRNGNTTLTSTTVSPSSTTTYTATCSTNSTCSSSVTVLVYSGATQCGVTATVSNSHIATGQSATLSYTGCAGGAVAWRNASNTLLQNTTVSPTSTTSYTATCSYTGITNTCASTVTVNVYTPCSFTVKAANYTIVSGSSVSLTATGCSGGTVSWQQGTSNLGTGLNLTVNPTANTTYTARCSYGGNSYTCNQSLSIVVVPSCFITAQASVSSVQAGQSVTMSHSGCSGGLVTWTDSNNKVYSNSALTILPTNTTTYTAKCSYSGLSTCASTVNVAVNHSISIGTITATSPTCSGGNNAKIKIPISRGIAGSETVIKLTLTQNNATVGTYFTTSNTFEEITNLTAGAYTVKVETLNGNTVLASSNVNFTITQTTAITVATVINNVKCFGGADGDYKITASAGQAPYSYDLNNTGLYKALETGNTITVKKQSVITYVLSVKDSRGCLATTRELVISQPANRLEATAVSQVNPRGFETADGQATVSVTGGTPSYFFEWADSLGVSYGNGITSEVSTNLNNTLRGGRYTVKIYDRNYASATDKAGCTTSKTFNLIEPPQLKIAFTVLKAASCADRADGAFEVALSGGVPFDTGLPYKLLVKHNVTNYQQQDNLHHENVPGGEYMMTITDQNDVSRTLLYTLPAPLPVVPVANIKNLKCNGDSNGSIELNVTGGTAPYTALWSTEAKGLKLENLIADKYLAIVYDSLQCETLVLAEVKQPEKLGVKFDAQNPLCSYSCDGTLQANIIGGTLPYTYTWADTTQKSLALNKLCHNTSHKISVTDTNGCTSIQSYQVPKLNSLEIPINTDKTICEASKIWLNAYLKPAKTYNWTWPNGLQTSDYEIVTDIQGKYELMLTDSSNCVFKKTINVKNSGAQAAKQFFSVPSTVLRNEQLLAINLLNPLPSLVTWNLPKTAKNINIKNTDASFSLHTPGLYTIGMQANFTDCEAYKTANIKIVETPNELVTSPATENVMILGANPNNGLFEVQLNLPQQTEYQVFVTRENATAQVLFQTKGVAKNDTKFVVDIPQAQAGQYLLYVKTNKEVLVKKIAVIH
jgi:trimeric autotransporter adhesin